MRYRAKIYLIVIHNILRLLFTTSITDPETGVAIVKIDYLVPVLTVFITKPKPMKK